MILFLSTTLYLIDCRADSSDSLLKHYLLTPYSTLTGRWAAATRLAYVRAILKANTDVCDGHQLSKTAPNVFPQNDYFDGWAVYFEAIWQEHINNVVEIAQRKDRTENFKYSISTWGEKGLIKALINCTDSALLVNRWFCLQMIFIVFMYVYIFFYVQIFLYVYITQY